MYKILIADDEKAEQQVITYLIQKYQFPLHIYSADNGQAAYEILLKHQVDILITDIQMPFINGLELAQKARQIYPSIEILFFSGYDDFEYVKQALSLRAVNYILKPINPEEFHQSIMDILESISDKNSISTQYEKYMEDNFYDYPIKDTSETDLQDVSSVSASNEDSEILSNIELYIRIKDATSLEQAVTSLLDKYQYCQSVSHIYIRYLFTTLLRYLINAVPHSSTEDFEQIAATIFTLKHFNEIREFISNYLTRAVNYFVADHASSKHAVFQIEQYIHAHYMDDLSLNQLSDIVYLSPKYLSNIFSQTSGVSINKYIRNVRMDKAKELLLETNMKIGDISLSIGYPNSSYFCKLFMEEFGQSPEKYRKNKGKTQ